MNRTVILVCVSLGSIVGSYVPTLFGESVFGGWSVLGGLVGGFFGLWLGVYISRRWE